jgi:hypothetical protein
VIFERTLLPTAACDPFSPPLPWQNLEKLNERRSVAE